MPPPFVHEDGYGEGEDGVGEETEADAGPEVVSGEGLGFVL